MQTKGSRKFQVVTCHRIWHISFENYTAKSYKLFDILIQIFYFHIIILLFSMEYDVIFIFVLSGLWQKILYNIEKLS